MQICRPATTESYLYSWTLERDDGSGNFAAVRADLISSMAVGFSIYNGSDDHDRVQFRTDGAMVTIGQGQLRVAIAVDEIAPVCTPLGSDCGDGAWCPPTGLTGAALACRSAGTVALGSTLRGPRRLRGEHRPASIPAPVRCAPRSVRASTSTLRARRAAPASARRSTTDCARRQRRYREPDPAGGATHTPLSRRAPEPHSVTGLPVWLARRRSACSSPASIVLL